MRPGIIKRESGIDMALDENILEQAVNLRALTGLKDVFATKKELADVPAGGAITFATAEDVVALFQAVKYNPWIHWGI